MSTRTVDGRINGKGRRAGSEGSLRDLEQTTGRILLTVASIATIILLLAPLVVILPLSVTETTILTWPPEGFTLDWFQRIVTDRAWTQPIVDSIRVAVTAAALATVLGVLAALGLVRGRFPGKSALNMFMISPLIVPTIVMAIGIFAFYSQLGLTGNFRGLVIAHAVHGIPYVVINVTAMLRSVDRNLELAAASLGAKPLRTFVSVTLPLIAPGVLAGALFAFMASWDEVVVAIFMTSARFRTLPVVMFSQLQFSIDPTVAAMSTVLVFISLALLVALAMTRKAEERA